MTSNKHTRRLRRAAHHYFSKHRYRTKAEEFLTIDRIYAPHIGIYSPWAVLYGILFVLTPLSYLYIAMVIVRELFGMHLIKFSYLPWLQQWTLASAISRWDVEGALEGTFMKMTPQRQWLWLWIEVWCYLEAIFYILLRIRISWLQRQDPLEANFSAAPLLELSERGDLWRRIMECEDGHTGAHISGWFFDENIENISAYDVRDFLAWSMFEGRHQEHLTTAELEQMEDFVDELQQRIGLELYGVAEYSDSDPKPTEVSFESREEPAWKQALPKPAKGELLRLLQAYTVSRMVFQPHPLLL